MNELSLWFPTVSAICSFLREVKRQNFVLLGKQSVLIAPFSADEIALAVDEYGAKMILVPEAELLQDRRSSVLLH